MRILFWFALAVLAGLGWAGCQPATPTPAATATSTATPTPTLRPRLTPYASPTPTPTRQQATPSPTPATAPPTATPWRYTVRQGDTLLGIALRFGVSLKALEEANPGVDPQAMAVGTQLIIPVDADNPAALPTPTPLPLQVGAPHCQPAADGSAVCLVEVSNPTDHAVAAVAVTFRLQNQATRAAEALLERLPAHAQTVLVARFPPPAPPNPIATARLLRALSLPSDQAQGRYPAVEIVSQQTQITVDGLMATVKGKLRLVGATRADEAWVVAVAYDAQGRPVAARRWEYEHSLRATRQVPFQFRLYSIAAPIRKVSVQAEAHVWATPTPHP